MALAIRTGIPPSVWAREGEAAIATAFELLDETDSGGHDGPPIVDGMREA
ncbi:hypothetical protein [Pseudonocardia sp. WMMC193]|nr:hypothetical protein [Pseudonocardia sp. WMMC193]MCF7548899.1 hypothetical protein [Pseudonocardia sp. WMMC193]